MNEKRRTSFWKGFGLTVGYLVGGLSLVGLIIGGCWVGKKVKAKFDSGEWTLGKKK